jgi:GNAT superfamily N-acetyltransferase
VIVPFGGYELDDDGERVDLPLVHSWLTETYWNRGCSLDFVRRARDGASMVVGAYRDGEQVGYLRVVSDGITFAWLSDVFVAEDHRGQGLAKAMVQFAVDNPGHEGMKRWLLATNDAHALYAELGFEPLPNPENWMIRGKTDLS